jgi:glycosyltransferase involved in cell wall biosynthesis
MTNPIVTVVIPTRNRPGLLLRAVKSALRQSLSDLEVVAVIDGEIGNATAGALKSIGDERVRFVQLRESVGGAEARNVGIREARGGWIALLDDDDEWLPGKLEAQLEAVSGRDNDGRVLVTTQHIHRAEGAADVVRPRRLPRTGEPPTEFMFDYLCYFQTSTFLCPTKLLLDIPFTKGLPFFHDIDWFLRVFQQPDVKLIVVPQPLSIYYAPEKRAAVSNAVNWKAKVEWGRANRHLMTRRSYSRFIVGSCVGAAVQDGAGLRGFARLFYECVFVGSPTPQLLAFLCGTWLLRPQWRKKLRDSFFLKHAAVPAGEQKAIG